MKPYQHDQSPTTAINFNGDYFDPMVVEIISNI
jgi:hypothetical protein